MPLSVLPLLKGDFMMIRNDGRQTQLLRQSDLLRRRDAIVTGQDRVRSLFYGSFY